MPTRSNASRVSQKVRDDRIERRRAMETRLQLAIDYIHDKQPTSSIRTIAKQYNVLRMTLAARLAGRQTLDNFHRGQQVLSPSEEKALVEAIEKLHSWGWPYRVSQVRLLAVSILHSRTGSTTKLGDSWMQRFLSRHPELKSRFSTPKDKERVMAENPEVFARWYELFLDMRSKYEITDRNTYNMDEKGAAMGLNRHSRVIISKLEMLATIVQDGSREWATLIECVSMDGFALAPQYIFKGKLIMKEWARNIRTPETVVSVSPNGWTDNELCVGWFADCFEPQSSIRCGEDDYRLLFVDGHGSHVAMEVLTFCEERKIILLCLPAHATHLLQPLDVGVFGPLSQAYQKNLELGTQYGGGFYVDKLQFLKYMQDARDEALTKDNILSAFRKSGLKPFDPDIVIDNLPGASLRDKVKTTFDFNTAPIIATPKAPKTRRLIAAVDLLNARKGIPATPRNYPEARDLCKASLVGDTLDPAFMKLNSFMEKMAAKEVINDITTEALATAYRKKPKSKRKRVNTEARHLTVQAMLDMEATEEAEKEAKQKEKDDLEAAKQAKRVKILEKKRNAEVTKQAKIMEILEKKELLAFGRLPSVYTNVRVWSSTSPKKTLLPNRRVIRLSAGTHPTVANDQSTSKLSSTSRSKLKPSTSLSEDLLSSAPILPPKKSSFNRTIRQPRRFEA